MKLPDAPVLEKARQWLAYGDEDLRLSRHGFGLSGAAPYRLIALVEEGLEVIEDSR